MYRSIPIDNVFFCLETIKKNLFSCKFQIFIVFPFESSAVKKQQHKKTKKRSLAAFALQLHQGSTQSSLAHSGKRVKYSKSGPL